MKNTAYKKFVAGLALWVAAGLARPLKADVPNGPATMPAEAHRPDPKIEGLWVWKSKYISDLAEQDKLLAFCQRQGFNRLLVQIPWKPGTAQIVHPKPGEEPPTGTALHPEISYRTEFARLISEASKHHIAVEALDGDSWMGDKVHRAETLATVDALIDFNKSVPPDSRFSGIHWDIEPYTRPDWKVQATRVPIETEYIDLLVQTRQKLQDAGSAMTLSVDIPMWYDNKTAPNDSCIVTYNDQTKNFHMFIQDYTDYVGIMSYRRNALGNNSAFEQIANELAYAEQIHKYVCPAFDTIKLNDTPQITFFGQTAEKLQGERQKLEDALKDRPGFGGMFIHNYPAIVAVLEPDQVTK
jgi:hypothetical protein